MSGFRSTPLTAWPGTDREAWEAAREPRRGLFGDGGSAAALRPDTVRLYEMRYGIWLRFLAEAGELHDGEAPAERMTPERLDLLVAAMEEAEQAPGTIRVAIVSLHAMLAKHMVPGAELDFMLRPGGCTLGQVFSSSPKPFPLVDTDQVMQGARKLRAAGQERVNRPKGLVMLRDAAIMAVFALRAPRVRTMAGLRLGTHVQPRRNGVFAFQLSEDIMKCTNTVAWDLAGEGAAMVEDYLVGARSSLLGRASTAPATDRLWIGLDGEPLDRIGVAAVFFRRTRDWFGIGSGPHAARKWLRDSAAARSPEAVFDAATVMGHSVGVSLRHYSAARDRAAGARHVAHLERERQETAALADQFFRQRGFLDR